ncbi:GLPGLI family protein [Polaribacter sp. M15]
MIRFLLPLFLLLFLLKIDFIRSQENNFIKVKYLKKIKPILNSDDPKLNNNNTKKLRYLLEKNLKNVEYILKIEDYHSLFELKMMNIDGENRSFQRLAGSIGGTKGDFYVNKRDSIFYNKKHFGGEDFKIKLNIRKWEITNEFKFIRNFKSYKATSKEVIINPKGKFEFQIIAWFCPELTSFFGPSSYFGLPGLILELDNGKTILQAKEIVISKSVENKIGPFKNGIEITQKEYDNLVNKKVKEKYGRFMKN